ncbi:MepB family protein [Paenibacillus sp. G2S3]|uniref:MepB family protein n=1 Tax=Paenibacillus sp. G2S3 TaxID=3047872 RepID=UPI0024C178C6|nr:MepB family protein [Paenibacillus sp. G2S3]WHY17669.1 MepB family protein [Paenibacillus sp. G2S3]
MKVKNQSFSDIIHSDLLATQELVYNPCNLDCSDLIREPHNADYGAYIFNLNALSIRFRVAKITPTKIGQFVTLWERIEDGPIQPYNFSDPADLFVISTRTENHFGQFVFPKAVLGKQDILSNNGEGGKRAIRVYPPWDNPTSRQAQKTQKWQLEYFLEIPADKTLDFLRAQMLYNFPVNNTV